MFLNTKVCQYGLGIQMTFHFKFGINLLPVGFGANIPRMFDKELTELVQQSSY